VVNSNNLLLKLGI